MVRSYTDRKRNPHFLTQLLRSVGWQIALSAEARPFTTDATLCLGHPSGRKTARYIRQALTGLSISVARNPYRSTALLRHCGIEVNTHRAWVDQHRMRCYLKSFREGFENNMSITYVGDKSVDSGEDWLCGFVYGFEVDLVGWCQPVATFEMKTELLEVPKGHL